MKSVLFSPFPVCQRMWEEKTLYCSADIEAKKKVALLLVVQVFSRLKTCSRHQRPL